MLEAEDTRALIQRVQAHDQWDFHAQGIAVACREMPQDNRQKYIAFCLAVAG